LAFLPSAHIFEFAMQMGMLALGAQVGFADSRSLSSSGAVRKKPDGTLNHEDTGFGNYPPGSIQEFAPTVMMGVPKIWDRLKRGVETSVGEPFVC
jgi:long-chain acyl-CoA synthetase